jgi:Domain of unknown function (DUF4105)
VRGALRRLAAAGLVMLAALPPRAAAGQGDRAASRGSQPPAAPVARAEPGASLDVSVVTFGQGEYVWERFGHNAIQVDDRATGMSEMWHWGLFDFDQPNFVGRFLTGDTKYWMEGFDPPSMIAAYERYDRTITVQRLAMTPAQKQALLDFLRWNERDEHKFYRYDYFRDNCSTRLRDALDGALGGALRRAMVPRLTTLTHRSESLRLVDGMPLTQAGMHVALGHPADRPMSAWETAFVPMRLRDDLRAIRVPDASGRPVALVADERVIYTSGREPEAARARALVPGFLVAGVLLAALLAGTGALAVRGSRLARAAFGTLGALWGFVPGVVGVVVLLAWTVTRHDFWDRNENLFQLGPQSLPLLVLVPLALARPAWRGRAQRWAVLVLAIAALGLVLKVLPWFRQPNLAVIALALPAHAALAWALSRRQRTRTLSGAK